MSLTQTVRDLTSRLSSATRDAQQQIVNLRARIRESAQRLREAEDCPLPLDELVEDRIPTLVAQAGRGWLQQHGGILLHGQRSIGSPKPGGAQLPWVGSEPMPFGAVCAADPELASAMLAALVGQVEYQAGPRSTDRPALIANLRAQLAELEAAEETAVDDASASGLQIEHRPEVMQRREQVARQRQLEEAALRDRRERQAALDRAAAERTGPVRSKYIYGGQR